MRVCAFVALLAVAGCASARLPEAEPVVPETVRVSGGVTSTRIGATPTVAAHEGTVRAPWDRVWSVLPAAYDSLGVQPTIIDPRTRTVGNGGFRLRRRLGNVPLSRYLNCGTMQAIPSADTYDVYLEVQTRISQTENGGTMLATTVNGMARPVSFSGDYAPCSSKGAFERALIEVVKAKLESSR